MTTATYYLVNYATADDWDCYMDDHGDSETIEDLAQPRGRLFAELEDAFHAFRSEYLDAFNDPTLEDYNDLNLYVEADEDDGLILRVYAPNGPDAPTLHFVMIARKIEVQVIMS